MPLYHGEEGRKEGRKDHRAAHAWPQPPFCVTPATDDSLQHSWREVWRVAQGSPLPPSPLTYLIHLTPSLPHSLSDHCFYSFLNPSCIYCFPSIIAVLFLFLFLFLLKYYFVFCFSHFYPSSFLSVHYLSSSIHLIFFPLSSFLLHHQLSSIHFLFYNPFPSLLHSFSSVSVLPVVSLLPLNRCETKTWRTIVSLWRPSNDSSAAVMQRVLHGPRQE